MALALLLRNSVKFNGAAFLKTASFSPLKTFTTVVAGPRMVQSLGLVKNVTPIARGISLSAPKMAAANHAPMWTAERAVSGLLLVAIPAAFMFPSQPLDALMAVAIVVHNHWGVEAMIVDYLRPNLVGTVAPKVGHISLYLLSITCLGGLFYLIYNDMGIANAVKKIWAVEGQ